jgi:probable phosphoglycerate mutase
MLLFYVRHGDPIYDPDQLTPLGEQQAAAIARRLARFGLTEIYASSSHRAQQTAMPTCELLGLPLQTLDFMNENYLDTLKRPVKGGKVTTSWIWSHPIYSELLASREIRAMGDEWYEHPALRDFHFERTLHPIYEQIDQFLSAHGYEHDKEKGLYRVTEHNYEKRVAIFAHECIGKIFMSHLLDIPFPSYATHFEMHTSALTVVHFDDSTHSTALRQPTPYARARVLSLSNDAHIYREDLSPEHRFTHLRDHY